MNRYFTGSITALWLVLSFISGPVNGAFGTLLAIGGETDIRKRIIPNTVCLLVALLGAGEIIAGPQEQVIWRCLNILISAVLLAILRLVFKGGIGMGDIKLLLACSFFMSVSAVMVGLALACLTAGIMGFVTTKSVRGEMPLAPFLAVSMTVIKMAETV